MTTTAEPQPGVRINIGEFKLGIGDDGARYRVYAEAEADSASLLRVHPEPESKKRTVATGLDSERPRFALPSNWSASEIDKAKTEITNLWKVHKRG